MAEQRNARRAATSRFIVLVVSICPSCIGLLSSARAVERSLEPPSRPQTEWYMGHRFLWRNFLTTDPGRPEYQPIFKRLPPKQLEAAAQLPNFDLVPLDLRNGNDNPRISYIYGVSGSLKSYAAFPELVHLDLYHRDDVDLRQLSGSTIEILTLPQGGVTTSSLSDLLGAQGSLPNLRHLDIFVSAERITPPKVLEVLKPRATLHSLQLSGRDVSDDWMALLPQLDQLVALRLFRTSVTPNGLVFLPRMKNLSHLAIADGPELTPDSVQSIAACPNLRELQLSGKNVTDETISRLVHLGIDRLAILDARITPASAKELGRLRKLKTLVINMKHPELLSALQDWRNADLKARELYANPDTNFGGWIRGLDVFWPYPREIDPLNIP